MSEKRCGTCTHFLNWRVPTSEPGECDAPLPKWFDGPSPMSSASYVFADDDRDCMVW